MTAPDPRSASAVRRPIALRMRPDLQVHPQRYAGRRYWGLKDPASLQYFHLSDEEYAILQMLDGRSSLDEIRRRFERRFVPLQLSLERLQSFLGTLHREGLVLSDAPGQGEQLLHRRRQGRRKQWLTAWTRILAIRFRGIDPEPLLGWLSPRVGWLFSSWFLAACVLLVLSAGTLAAVHFDVLLAKLPTFQAFFNARNVVWLAAALAVVKVMHELGHALTCKHFGGECHEMGVLFLVFTPCLYCNVSDAWMMPEKWRRIAISAAGIGVEIVVAALCTFLWWFSQPGWLNTLLLNMMFVCSVSTLLFNGNPLLRYDGYYILADLVETPNLAQRSSAALKSLLARLCLGLEAHDDFGMSARRRLLLAAYAAASLVYRCAVLGMILWFCYKVLEPYRLQSLAVLLGLTVVAGMLIMPVSAALQFVNNPARVRQVDRGRARLTGLLVLSAACAACLIPLPFHIVAPAVLEPRGAERVYVTVPGRLAECVEPGEAVVPGQVLGKLVNRNVHREVELLRAELRQWELQLQHLESRRTYDPQAQSQIPAAREALADARQRLEQRLRDERQLELAAKTGGVVLPPPYQTRRPRERGRIGVWAGSPLEPQNRGCHLETGTLFCLVGDPSQLEAVLVVNQADVQFVRPGQRVALQFDGLPGTTLTGTIEDVAQDDLKIAPRELAGGRELAVRPDAAGAPRLQEISYQARVALDPHEHSLVLRASGRAKIAAGSQPLGRRLYRFLRRTFQLEL